MLFRNSYRPSSQQLVTGGWAGLADMLGIPLSDLPLTESSSMKEITVYTCIKIRSEAVAKLPIKIYRADENGAQKAVNDYRYNLLKLRPNPYMSAYDFWRAMQTRMDSYGNSYALIDSAASGRNAGKIQGLYPVKSDQMTVYVDDVGLLSGKNRVWYKYRDDAGNEMLLDSDSVLHLKGFTYDGLIGVTPLEHLRASIENAVNATRYLNTSYKKGLQTGGILQYVGDLDPDKQKALAGKYEQLMSGVGNANRLSVIPVGLTYTPIALKMTDAQFLENTRLTIQQLTAAYGIKPHQVNDQTKTSYASTAEANREFYTDTLMAILTMYEQELNYKLFTQSEIDAGYYIKFNVDVILRASPQQRYAMYAQAVQNMVLTPNECRDMEEKPHQPGGDVLYGNSALAPAELLAQGLAMKNKGGDNGNGENT